MKKLFVTMCAILAVGFASAQSEVIAKFNEGVTAIQGKNYTSAIALFETVIDKGAPKTLTVFHLCLSGFSALRKATVLSNKFSGTSSVT